MPGSTQYHERCVCGATITLTENYDFTSSGKLSKRFDEWKRQHKNCLALFHQVQAVRMKQLEQVKMKLLK